MAKLLLPETSKIPENLQTEHFQFEILEPSLADQDYEAVMSSRVRLRGLFGKNDDWPLDSLTLESNIEDLQRHESEFYAREAFAYSVFSPNKERYIGCVYLFQSTVVEYDCEVYLWVRDSEIALEADLFTNVKLWLNDHWPFRQVAFPGREISWSDWHGTRHW